MKRMQAGTESQGSQAAENSERAGEQASTSGDAVPQSRVALHFAAVVQPRTLVQLLAAAALEKRGWPALLESLDLYAVQELEVMREEAKRREDDSLQFTYCAAVLGKLEGGYKRKVELDEGAKWRVSSPQLKHQQPPNRQLLPF
jgi:hypothetical protein